MNLGELRHPVDVQEYKFVSQDPVTGQAIYDWVKVGTLWAKVEGISGNAFIAASAEQRKTNLRLTMMQRQLDPLAQRLRFDGQDHKIEAVLPNNVPALMTVMVSRLA